MERLNGEAVSFYVVMLLRFLLYRKFRCTALSEKGCLNISSRAMITFGILGISGILPMKSE